MCWAPGWKRDAGVALVVVAEPCATFTLFDAVGIVYTDSVYKYCMLLEVCCFIHSAESSLNTPCNL